MEAQAVHCRRAKTKVLIACPCDISACHSVCATQVTVTDSEGLTDTETLTMIIGEPFSLAMNPKSGKWVVGDTIQVHRNENRLWRYY